MKNDSGLVSFFSLPLDHVNSATKYPSIPTYHVLKGRGNLTEERSTVFGDEAIYTEKIDGTNGRIVFFADAGDYLIGSREELLYARGDRVPNQSERIVEAMRPLAESMVEKRRTVAGPVDIVLVLWGEVFGGKQYSGNGGIALRIFDAARFSGDGFADVCARERPSIASGVITATSRSCRTKICSGYHACTASSSPHAYPFPARRPPASPRRTNGSGRCCRSAPT